MTTLLNPNIEKQFWDNFTVPTMFSDKDRGTCRFPDSPNWYFSSDCGNTNMLYLDVGNGLDFTITFWKKSRRLAFMYGHDDDAFCEFGEEKHENFSCMVIVPESEEQHFMDSTVKELPLSYELMSKLIEFFDLAENIPIATIPTN